MPQRRIARVDGCSCVRGSRHMPVAAPQLAAGREAPAANEVAIAATATQPVFQLKHFLNIHASLRPNNQVRSSTALSTITNQTRVVDRCRDRLSSIRTRPCRRRLRPFGSPTGVALGRNPDHVEPSFCPRKDSPMRLGRVARMMGRSRPRQSYQPDEA